MAINGVGLTVVAVGIAFAYGGLTGRSPTAVILSTVRGTIPENVPSSSLASTPTGIATDPVSTPDASSPNQKVGLLLAAQYGWNTGTEWQDLVALWNKESGWSNTADTRVTHAGGDNSSSTTFAYGIAQARPATKYPIAGRPPDLGGTSDAQAQIQWGLDYIKGRYGKPSAAWAHELANNWY